jgi:hypothetical protein
MQLYTPISAFDCVGFSSKEGALMGEVVLIRGAVSSLTTLDRGV